MLDNNGNPRADPREERPPWQFTLRDLLVLAAIVAIACIFVAWWGALIVLAVLGAAGGAFLGALICPFVYLDAVLDDLRWDVVKCLGLGGYLVGGTWVMVTGIKWLVYHAWSRTVPVTITGGVILFFMATTVVLVRALWSQAENVEAVVIAFATLLGVFVVLTAAGL